MVRIPRAIAGLSLAGAGVSAYLFSYRLSNKPVYCLTGSGCAEVSASIYSELFGVPVSALGLALYMALLAGAVMWALAVGRARPAPQVPEWLPLGIFGLALVGFLFSAYLTWVEAFILYAYCSWCLTSFGIITVILALSVAGVLRKPS